MADLKQALEELLAASREAAKGWDHAFRAKVGDSAAQMHGLAPLKEFHKAIEKAEQALKDDGGKA